MVLNASNSRKELFHLLRNNRKSQFNTCLSFSAGSLFLTLGQYPLLCLCLLKLGKLLGLSAILTLPATSFALSEALLFPFSILLSPPCINRTNATAAFAFVPRLISFCCSELRAVPYNAARVSQAGVAVHSFRDTRHSEAPPHCHEFVAGVGSYSGKACSVRLEEE